MGKGDDYRPVNKKVYDKNYLRIYGEICNGCKGRGISGIGDFSDRDTVCTVHPCLDCNGVGYVPKKKT